MDIFVLLEFFWGLAIFLICLDIDYLLKMTCH